MPPSHTVRTLQEQFQKFGEIEYVEKNQDHGFVKFASHQSAIKAMVEHKGVVSIFFFPFFFLFLFFCLLP